MDAIVSTIGFPLVGGPVGFMEAGRQVEVAKRILSAKNVPYLVAAPLLIQDIHSWTRQGIGGLQSLTQGLFLIHSIFVVQVQAVEPIVAPSYRLKPESQ